ncbi:MAG TPA: FAD-dependent oxidoreductase [Spirochaetota bacterium]|nr:FAD-dependent oxidoreductase [Spirochaetota bacterium]HPI89798.1 FAD-dependent oxidoreductase [Spirochaetota bacterium]HPR47561.1 FAD-dependent oxidoreductase [Spirochaetota bacterium]
MKRYDVIIAGAGPSGIFIALELLRSGMKKKILILEKGKPIEERHCFKRENGVCRNCRPCNITTGFSGAGAYSDGKLILSTETGGFLSEYVDDEELREMISYVDSIYLSYGADKKVYGLEETDVLRKLRNRVIQSNLRLVESPLRHIGTEKCYEIYSVIQKELLDRGVEISFRNPVNDLIVQDGSVVGVVADSEYFSDRVILAAGREGAGWMDQLCKKYGIQTRVGGVDIGVRIEVRNEIMEEVNRAVYESKLIYYTPTFDDRVRTFCNNPSGFVATEFYDSGLAVVNGHSYKGEEHKTDNTNFAVLVSNYFTDPFREPLEYGKYIARLANMLSGGKVIIQRLGDFRRGRRTTSARLRRNNIVPSLDDAVPGDLSLVFPYRIMLDIKEMIQALDSVFPGISSDETLLYGVEVKFYSNIISVKRNFETAVNGLYVAGDGAGITRGLLQASINGVMIGRELLKAWGFGHRKNTNPLKML